MWWYVTILQCLRSLLLAIFYLALDSALLNNPFHLVTHHRLLLWSILILPASTSTVVCSRAIGG